MKCFLSVLAAVLFVLARAGDEENLALGRPYTMVPPPNHALCSGPEDATDLTDGKFTVKQPMAVDQGAAGWRVGRSSEVCITIDLEAVKWFNRVTFSTGGGSPSISYPDFINVEVSTDGSKFYQLGSLTALSKNPWPPVDAGYRNLILDADFQTVEARYIRLRCVVSGLFMFCDEIEVYADTAPPVQLQTLAPALESEEFLHTLPALIIENCIRRSYSTLLGRIKKQLTAPELLAQAATLGKRIQQWTLPGQAADFRAVYPIDLLHRDIFRLNAANSLRENLAVWETPVYDPLDALAEPAVQTETHLQVAMMNHERRMAAVNLRSGGLKPVEITAVLKDLPGRIYRTEFLDANSLRQTSTVLRQVEGPFTVYPGLASQLVLEFAPDTLPAGENRGILELSHEGERREIPITLAIAKKRFPDKTALSSGMWDYLEFLPQPLQRRSHRWPGAVLRDIQKEHLIHVTFGYHILGNACRPQHYLAKEDLDFSGFDNWVRNWPDAEHYVLYLSLKADSKPNGMAPGSPEFNAAVKKWAERWDLHLETLGLVDGKLVFQLIDEPRTEQDYAVLQHWIKAFKSGSRHIALFSNPLQFKTEYAKYLEGTDILCPIAPLMFDYASAPAAALRKHAVSPEKLWVYRCSAGPFNTDPGYYRNQAWLAYRNNAVGSMFWALGDIGRSANNGRNQYLTRPVYYSPLIFDGSRIDPTKHLKAIRDGIQDYEYLVILSGMINSAKNIGADTSRAEALIREALLHLTRPESLGQLNPNGSSPASSAEKYRLDILRLIERGFD
jgi:hypothetical protein